MTAVALLLSVGLICGVCHAEAKTIAWDPDTLVQVNKGGTYARMIRLPGDDILCSFEDGGKAWVIRSSDNGKTWSEKTFIASSPTAAVANPELLSLANGWVVCFYNERPSDGVHHFTIQVSVSKDSGKTWQHLSEAYVADVTFENGCWEPVGIQLAGGEVQLFFANEFPYPHSTEQEITLMRSFDNGKSWSEPKAVSFRAGHRDGMPVPCVLNNGKGIVLVIEDNGYSQVFVPSIVHTTMADNWSQSAAGAGSPRRWRAIRPMPGKELGGAPYITQMPTGETIMSFQSRAGREQPQMVVYVGDENARDFDGETAPFDLPSEEGGWWNSLFVRDDHTITAVSACRGGIWTIDGHIKSAQSSGNRAR